MKKVLLFLLVVVVGFAAYVATRPDTYHVERSATIAAAPDVIEARIVDFHSWPGWSPWEKLDPNMTRTHEGPASGVGAVYAWRGNDKVGEGRMTIAEVVPASRVAIRLEFLKPMASTSTSAFTFAPEGGATRVTWTMDGNHNYVSKAMCVFMDMDKMIGTDLEKGLANLKTLAEAAPPTAAPGDSAAADTAAAPAP